MKKLLLAIDFQEGFRSREVENIIPNVQNFINGFKTPIAKLNLD